MSDGLFGDQFLGDDGIFAGLDDVPTPDVVTDTFSGGYEYAIRAPRRRTEEELLEARIRFGVLPQPAAESPVALAVVAQARAVASVDTPAKLAAARAVLEAEDAYRSVYQAVYEDLRREDASELFRLELEAVRVAAQEKLRLRRRKAAMILLLN